MGFILVVDDLPVFREPISAILREAGYQTKTAEDGAAALEIIRSTPPDLVFLDINMPGMDGLQVVSILRADLQLKAIPVVLLTDSSDRATVLRARATGVQGYLLKSRFSAQELLARAAEHVPKPPLSAERAGAGVEAPPRAGELAPASAAPPLTRDAFLERVKRTAKAKALPGVVADVFAGHFRLCGHFFLGHPRSASCSL